MRFPIKLAIGCGVAFIFIILCGFIGFPKMIKSKVRKMVNLDKSSELRSMFVKIPFPLGFKIYFFNVTNPMEIQKGELPRITEVGPFCYQEWKEKVDVGDIDEEDMMYYKWKDTFYSDPGPGCVPEDELVTIPHPLILGMVNTVVRQKPAMLSLINKAIKSIYNNPTSIFLTAKASDILFNGVVINCGVKDFAGKAVCTQLKAEGADLKHISDDELAFSLMGPKNGTAGKVFKVYRGVKVNRDVGKIVEYDGKKEMDVWPTKQCNQIQGTDGTIFPPLMKKEEGLVSYSGELCRSLVAVYSRKAKYNGLPVNVFTATLGDMSKNADEKCYCYTPDTCLKKGLMDLYKCAGIPLYVSLPHFYESDESYVKGVIGLNPNEKDHGIRILFEQMTGSPVSAAKRLQFNMPLEPNEKVELFHSLPNTVLPIFWVEEAVSLNKTLTKPLNDFFMIMKVVKVIKWLVLLGSLGGMAAAGYLFFKKKGAADITPVKPASVNPHSGISTVNDNGFGGHVNHAMSDNEINKY